MQNSYLIQKTLNNMELCRLSICTCVIEPTMVFANEVIMREQTTGDEMFFIGSGVVEIFISSSKSASYLAIGDGCVSIIHYSSCCHLPSFPLLIS